MAFSLGKIGIPIVNSLGNIEFLIDSLVKKLLESFDVCDIMGSLSSKEVEEGIMKIIELRNNLVELLINIKSKLEDLKNILNIIQPILISLQAIIIIIKALPLPNQFTTTSVTTALADTVKVLQDIVDTGTAIVTSINQIIDKLLPKIEKFIEILNLLDIRLNKCIKDFSDKQVEEDNENLDLINRGIDITDIKTNNTLRLLDRLSPVPQSEIGTIQSSYKGFTFEIKIKKTIENTSQNYAVALDSRNIEVLAGRPSFSSSTKVLIDELKLIIDQQNLNGF